MQLKMAKKCYNCFTDEIKSWNQSWAQQNKDVITNKGEAPN